MAELTAEDHAILSQQSMETLAKWHCELNRWGWPEDLPDPEPAVYTPGSRRSAIMRWINDAVGFRVINREWNRDMTDEEHNDFWRGNFEGHEPSRERSYQRLRAQILGSMYLSKGG